MKQKLPRILSIDDNPSIGRLMVRVFQDTGRYEVAVETDPNRAVETALEFRPDLIILDLNMPGQNGLDIARLLRAEPWLRFRPIVIFSGVRFPMEMNRVASLGGTIDFVEKGEALQVVVKMVDRLLAQPR